MACGSMPRKTRRAARRAKDDAERAMGRATRAALGRAWRSDGRMEHASVASFARFTLAMMAMGARAPAAAAS